MERSKSKILNYLEKHQYLVVMDWAMKWLPKRFRETLSEWFGKKGISWHVSAFITCTENTDAEFEVIGILIFRKAAVRSVQEESIASTCQGPL